MENKTGAAGRIREDWIDVLRAAALLLVIFGHQKSVGYGYFLLTSPVKIPLFFAISGFVFNESRRDIRAFAARLLRHLVVPWLSLGLLGTLAESALTGMRNLPESLYNLLIGESAWYLPCCIVAECLWFLILRTMKRESGVICAAADMCALGLLAARMGWLNLWMANRAMIAQVYLLIGYLCRRHRSRLEGFGWRVPVACAALYIGLTALSCALYPGKSLDVHQNHYDNVPLCMAIIGAGNVALFTACGRYMKRAPRWLCWFGQNTLVIYMLHNYSVRLPVHLLRFARLPVLLPLVLAAMVPVCALYMLLAAVINRFAPELAGRTRAPRA